MMVRRAEQDWTKFRYQRDAHPTEGIPFQRDLAVMRVQRHDVLHVLCLFPFIFTIFYR